MGSTPHHPSHGPWLPIETPRIGDSVTPHGCQGPPRPRQASRPISADAEKKSVVLQPCGFPHIRYGIYTPLTR